MRPEYVQQLRDYGHGDIGEPIGPPVATPFTQPASCPNCTCANLMEIKVPMRSKLPGRKGEGVGVYIGCPACPWASELVLMIARSEDNG